MRDYNSHSVYALGVDFARLGQDFSSFIIVEKPYNSPDLFVVLVKETQHKLLTDAIGKIILLDNTFHFDKINLDETGMGSGPTDVLKEKFTYKVEGVTFTLKNKMNIYNNLRRLLELGARGKPGGLHLPTKDKCSKLLYQLLDLRYEIISSGDMKIHHSDRGHDDLTDALALACWHWQPGKVIDAGGLFSIS